MRTLEEYERWCRQRAGIPDSNTESEVGEKLQDDFARALRLALSGNPEPMEQFIQEAKELERRRLEDEKEVLMLKIQRVVGGRITHLNGYGSSNALDGLPAL
jgi:hypothetical protein